jgi:hypothetical protein
MASRRRAGVALLSALALALSWASGAASPARAITVLSLSPSPLDVGSVYLGSSNSGDVTITNNTGASVTINTIAVTTGALEFAVTGGTCAVGTLGAGLSCTVAITFSPQTATGLQSAGSLHVNSTEGGDQYDTLHGTGLNPMPGGGSFDYGDQPKNSTSSGQDATIANAGTQAVTPVSAAITGANPGDFTKTADSCTGVSVSPTASCTVTVAFHPTAMGARTATLTISFPSPIPAVTYSLSGNGTAPNSSVVWKSLIKPGPNYAWNFGLDLARTVKSGVQQLHLVYQTDVIGGKTVSDTGPYLGVYYIHSTTGSTWTSPKRLNPTTQHASREAIAATGSHVYVAWVSLKHWVNQLSADPRVLYISVNTNHGASSSWKTAKRLTATSGQVDFPTVAAYGKYVFVTWTDAKSGAVNIARSSDYGSTFKITKLGTTSYKASSGFKGLPKVSVSGANVIVGWIANATGALVVRQSTNRGSTWGTKTTVTSSSWATDSDGFSVTNRSTRAAVTWTDAGGVKLRVKTSSWATARVVAGPSGNDQYQPAVALQGTAQVAVSWSEYSSGANEPLLWAESPNNGVAFYQPQTVADNSDPLHSGNEIPSLLWVSSSTRLVAWNGFDSSDNNYRIYFRTGTGTPTGLLHTAPLASSVASATVTAHRFHGEDRPAAR